MKGPDGDSAMDSHRLRPGIVVGGKFVLLRRLGEGGVGVVFEAEDTWIGRRVALKVLHADLAQQPDMLARFRREARAAALTNHPNIVAVYEVGKWHDGSPYIVEELLDGQTLRDRLTERQRLPAMEAIEILVPIMGAAAAAHRAGIVHRDIKPENIFLTRNDDGETVPKLIDFGIAKMTESGDEPTTLTGSVVGTPSYMSPEQARGEPDADPRTDVWSMGAVLYEMLSGRCPYEAGSSPAVLAKLLTEAPKPLVERARDVPLPLAAVVHKALERDLGRRYETMRAMLEAVLAYAHEPDPTLSERHARSLPPPAPDPAPAVVAPAPPPMPVAPARPRSDTLGEEPVIAEWVRPMVTPELGWYEAGGSPRRPRDVAWYANAAGQALRDNALDEAIDHAEHAVVSCRAQGPLRGQMRLVQATAYRWLGHYDDAERCAAEAVEVLPRASPSYFAALGHVALIAGYLGDHEQLNSVYTQLAALVAEGDVSSAHVVAASRLALSLVRAGFVDRAHRALAAARAGAGPHVEEESMVRAWIHVAIAEFAMHAGDPAAYLTHLESSVGFFGEAGDVRNACLQRANIGNAYMQLGAYARAKGPLRETITVGEPMRLGFIAPVRANLGLVLARLGDVEAAFEVETEALEQCARDQLRRFELCSRIFLATILTMRGEPEHALVELRVAVDGADGLPPIRAYALANLGDLFLTMGRKDEALTAAGEAMRVLQALEGAVEGESLIRLVHALALEAAGEAEPAREAILEARQRLLERARRISDPRLRRSFLDHVPENRRTLAASSRHDNPPR